jgi:acetyl-CoA carboxylase biotin carboxyl carrier protein
VELRPDDIAEILRVFAESDLEELHLDIGGTRLDLSKNSSGGRPVAPPRAAAAPTAAVAAAPAADAPAVTPAPTAPAAATASQPDSGAAASRSTEDGLVELRSPLLGVFYRRPSPDKPAFVESGSSVEADDPVCIVDVMKMFTRVPAGTAGTIVDILVEDGTLVEHGQVLMTIRPR